MAAELKAEVAKLGQEAAVKDAELAALRQDLAVAEEEVRKLKQSSSSAAAAVGAVQSPDGVQLEKERGEALMRRIADLEEELMKGKERSLRNAEEEVRSCVSVCLVAAWLGMMSACLCRKRSFLSERRYFFFTHTSCLSRKRREQQSVAAL